MSIAQRLDELRQSVAVACAGAGRAPESVRILAVSKRQSVELIEEAYVAGLRDFGENYVQELLDKRARLAHLSGLRWHLVGHLQTKKARQVVDEIDSFHALDSEKLARELARRAVKPLSVYIQVNVDDEPTKSGVPVGEVERLASVVRSEPKLLLEGLMCLPEPREPAVLMRPAFRRLAMIARKIESGRPLLLSMGMSSDFAVAIEEGANWIRVGTRLCGERSVHSA